MVTFNGKEYHGLLGLVIAIPIVVFTFSTIAFTFLYVSLILTAPIWVIALIVWLVTK